MAISAAQALISGPSRMVGIMAAGTSMVLGAEIALRALLTASSLLQHQKLPNDYQFQDKTWFSENVVDFRALTRDQEMTSVCKNFVKAAIATMAISAIIHKLFGSPVTGINLVGKFFGVQFSSHGVYHDLSHMAISDWTKFFHQPNA